MHSGQSDILTFCWFVFVFFAFKPGVSVHLLFLWCECCFDGGRWCPLVKPTLFSIQSGSDPDYCGLLRLVLNETSAVLIFLCKLTVCMCVLICCCMLARFLNGLRLNVFKYFLLRTFNSFVQCKEHEVLFLVRTFICRHPRISTPHGRCSHPFDNKYKEITGNFWTNHTLKQWRPKRDSRALQCREPKCLLWTKM